MNTPLMELIETLSEYYYSETFPNSEKSGIKLSIDCAVQGLGKERRIIVDANIAGMEFIPVDPNKYEEDGQDYYTKTFTDESK